jgi:excisionase family DNA binding protein
MEAMAMGALLTTEQAAAKLGLGTNTLEKYRVFGTGPTFVKLGRSVRYAESDLDEWVAARRLTSTSEEVRA